MFGSLGNMMGLLGNLGKIGKEYKQAMEELKAKRIEGRAGGEQVRAVVNGLGDLVEIKIAPELVAGGDVEMVEDLVLAAVNSATEQAREVAQEQMAKLTESLPLGPLKGLLGQ
ncbi:MAG: YbaB/EbfC family nucleoid-associated protein [Phycisphaerae bacterium]|nr:YbaB/EbfC family nucleoid-associated protein [Phycisphaerae bacterium]